MPQYQVKPELGFALLPKVGRKRGGEIFAAEGLDYLIPSVLLRYEAAAAPAEEMQAAPAQDVAAEPAPSAPLTPISAFREDTVFVDVSAAARDIETPVASTPVSAVVEDPEMDADMDAAVRATKPKKGKK